jgi:DtxR family Mn-dependent transcriptional regulator
MLNNLMNKENLEEYMELFYQLDQSGEKIRTKTIADELKTTKGNVSQALTKLKKDKLIEYAPYQDIKLTTKGREIGKKIKHNHEISEEFLIKKLGVDPKQAHREACKIEHALSGSTINKLARFLNEK